MAIAPRAMAIAIYNYTGNNFTFALDLNPPAGTNFTVADRVAGSFTLAAPLAPNMPLTDISGSIISYSFTAGSNLLTNLNSTFFGGFDVGTDALGNISQWQMTAVSGPPLPGTGVPGDQRELIQTTALGFFLDRGILQECTGAGPSCGSVATDLGSIGNAPGTWVVPEPSTALLLLFGLIAAVRAERGSR